MKRSMIAVCLLLLSPSGVMACYEDHNAGAGWFDPEASRWPNYGSAARALHHDKLMDVSLLAGGSGVAILIGVLIRAMCRAGRQPVSRLQPVTRVPLAVPIDRPTSEPFYTQAGMDPDDRCWSSSGTFSFDDEHVASGNLAIDSVMCYH
jgi:hypothetical protein